MVPFLQVSPQKSCMHFFSPPYLWYDATSHPPLFDHANNIWRLQTSQSQWLYSLRHGSATTCLLGVQVQIPPGVRVFISYKRCLLSGRDLCDGLIPCPEEYYQVCVCVCVCVSISAIRCNNNPNHLQWVALRGQTEKERKKRSTTNENLHYAIFPTLLLLPPT